MLVNLVNNLDSQKYDVTVQTLFDVGVNRQYLAPHIHYIGGYKRHIRGTTTLMKLFSPSFLYRFWIHGDYDVLISYLEGPTSRIIAGCPNKDKKKIAWLHIELNTPRQAAIGFRSPNEARRMYNTYDKLVAVADSVREIFLNSLPLAVPVEVLYNTNETEKIIELAKAPICDGECLNAGIRICSVAKLVAAKGFDRLLNVHKRLMDEGFLHTVYILGIGEEEDKLRRRIREYGVEASFILLGFKDNPYQYVSRCDLYVCSSRREGFSTAVTESLIIGTPVISTDCSGARELLGEHDEYGLVVENSEDGIYRGIKRMLSEPDTLAHYKKMAEQRGHFFSREKTVAAVEEMIEGL